MFCYLFFIIFITTRRGALKVMPTKEEIKALLK